MIRAVLAVAVTVGLLATAGAPLADARVESTRADLAQTAERVGNAAAALADGSAAVADPELAARTTLRVAVPSGFDAAPVERAAIGCPADIFDGHDAPRTGEGSGPCEVALAYRLRGEDPAILPVPGIDLRTPEGPVPIGTDETALKLQYVRADGNATVRAVVATADRSAAIAARV